MDPIVYRRAADLLEAHLDEELVALEPKRGECFGFNEVATRVWESLETPKSFDELRDELLQCYDVSPDQCTRELRDLVDDLLDKGLVARDEGFA